MKLTLACKPVHAYRNKLIAHNDLKIKLDPINNPLPVVTRKQIEEILRLMKRL